jgi:hypothetical protein
LWPADGIAEAIPKNYSTLLSARPSGTWCAGIRRFPCTVCRSDSRSSSGKSLTSAGRDVLRLEVLLRQIENGGSSSFAALEEESSVLAEGNVVQIALTLTPSHGFDCRSN